jgi:hypothetical protein
MNSNEKKWRFPNSISEFSRGKKNEENKKRRAKVNGGI